MNRLRRFLIRMAAFLGAVAVVAAILSPGLTSAFLANPALNALIIGVFLVGVVLNFRQVLLLRGDMNWLESAKRGHPPSLSTDQPPRLLAPLAAMWGERHRLTLTPIATRSLLDGIGTRLDEGRELARYFVGLLIFLGLLGTFWGLSVTVGHIGEVIQTLSVTGDDFTSAFERLKQGLESPLGGMGTAFASSLFGLAGSLVVGFLDLQAGQAQNAFYNDLEDWLSGQTRLGGGGSLTVEGNEAPVPAYLQALLEQTAESLDNLQRIIARGQESQSATGAGIRALTERLSTLTDQMRTEQGLMHRLAESQMELRPVLQRLAAGGGDAGVLDETTRGHIRSLDTAVGRLVEELASGREELVREMRSEIKLLARTIAVREGSRSETPREEADREESRWP